MTLARLVLLAVLATAALGFFTAPSFELNLDLPPSQRWGGAVRAVVNAHGFNYSFGPVLAYYFPQVFLLPSGTAEALDAFLQTNFPDHHAELGSIAAAVEALGYPYPVKYWSAFVYVYEFGHITSLSLFRKFANFRSCTGILSLPQDPSQPIIHGRNMDEDPAAGRNLTLHINVTRNGVVLYEVFDWAWVSTGFLTTSRQGGITTEENWRNFGSATYSEMMQRMTTPGTVPSQFIHRIAQERGLNFQEALQYFTTVQLAAPLYIVMSGMGRQGAVLSVSVNASETVVALLNDSSAVPYMVQTNYDRWLPDPVMDPRRTAALATLSAVGPMRAGTELGVWMALSGWPVHNPETMYSVLMSPGRLLEGYIRVAMQPIGWNQYPW